MTKISAHAGFDNTKENTLESISKAMELGVDILELDILMHEGVPVLSHNKPKAGENPTKVAQALELLKPSSIVINCDVKEEEVILHTLELIKEYGFDDRYFFTGNCSLNSKKALPYKFFINAENPAVLDGFKMIDETRANYLIELFAKAANPQLLGFNIKYSCIDDKAIEMLNKANIPVICWTVDKQDSLNKFLKSGIYAVTTNNVSYAQKVQKKLLV